MPVTKAVPSRVKHWKTVHSMSTSHLSGRNPLLSSSINKGTCINKVLRRTGIKNPYRRCRALRNASARLKAPPTNATKIAISCTIEVTPTRFGAPFRCKGGGMPPHRPAEMQALPQRDACARPPQFLCAGFTRTSFAGAKTLGTLTEAAMISFFCPMSCGTQTVVIAVVELPDSSVTRMTIV